MWLPFSTLGCTLVAIPLVVRGLIRVDQTPLSLYDNVGLDEIEDEDLQTPREKLLWKLALSESSQNPDAVTSFGRKAAKYPKSWVDQILALDHTKKFRYSFQGAGFTTSQLRNRKWLFKFIRNNFREGDYLRFTDAPSNYGGMGVYDYTLKNEPGGFHPKGAEVRDEFDLHYYQVMAASNFTLCPGGETPWSMRLYETALAGSIPVIYSEASDFDPPHRAAWLKTVGYEYLKTDLDRPELTYRQDIIDKNRKLFIRYQTFLEGDNDPAHAPKDEDELKQEENAGLETVNTGRETASSNSMVKEQRVVDAKEENAADNVEEVQSLQNGGEAQNSQGTVQEEVAVENGGETQSSQGTVQEEAAVEIGGEIQSSQGTVQEEGTVENGGETQSSQGTVQEEAAVENGGETQSSQGTVQGEAAVENGVEIQSSQGTVQEEGTVENGGETQSSQGTVQEEGAVENGKETAVSQGSAQEEEVVDIGGEAASSQNIIQEEEVAD